MDSYVPFSNGFIPITKRQRFSVGSQLKGLQNWTGAKLVGLAVFSRLLFGRCMVQISAGTLAVLRFFVVFLSPSM
jgi:hypothetical protein